MIVVDSNILACLYLPGEFTEPAEVLFESDPDWAAPVLWRSEFRNILATYVRRLAWPGQAVGHRIGHDGWQAAASVSGDCAWTRCCEMKNGSSPESLRLEI